MRCLPVKVDFFLGTSGGVGAQVGVRWLLLWKDREGENKSEFIEKLIFGLFASFWYRVT